MKPTKRLPRELVAIGIGLGFSIAATGCAFLVDFDYQEAGQGGGSTSSGVSATGAGGGAAGCISECGGCLASSNQGTGEGTCGLVEPTPRVDAGYSLMPPAGILPPEIRDVDSGNGFVYVVGTFEQNLTTTSAGPINNQGYPEGLLARLDPNAPTQAVAKRLVGCSGTNQSYEPLLLAAAAWDGTSPPGELVVAGGFAAAALHLADLDSTDPCGASSRVVLTKDTEQGMAPFLLRLNAELNQASTSEVIAVPQNEPDAYFSALSLVQGDDSGPPVVVALGVARGTVTYYGNNLPTGEPVEIMGPEAGPGYFLYAIDMQERNAHLQPLNDYGPCPGIDDVNRYWGLDSALVARSPWAGSPAVSVGYGLTNGGDECGSTGRGAAVGGLALRWNENATGRKLQFDPPGVPVLLGGAEGSDASIRAMTLLPDPGLLAVAGTYRGRLGVEGEPEGDASEDGYIAVFRPELNAQQLDPRWVRRIEGDPGTSDGSRVEVGGLSAQLRMNGTTRLLAAATVPKAGVFGPLGPTSVLPPAEWCLAGPGRRVLVASLDGETGEVVGASLLGDAYGTDDRGVAATALASASDRAYVAVSALGPVAIECTGEQTLASGFGSVHLRTLNFD